MAFVLEDAPTEPGGYGTQGMNDANLRSESLPFDPSGTSPLATAGHGRSGPEPGPPLPEAGETAVSPGNGRVRLVRFDPQTGQRVARPYWEIVPR